ncbi:uncharacterized protein V6R79_024739 [Siganus canaliculatus]
MDDLYSHGTVPFLLAEFALGVGAFITVFYVQWKSMGMLCSSSLHGFQNVRTFLCALLTMDAIHVVVTVLYLLFIEIIYIFFGGPLLLSLSIYFMVLVHLITALTLICFLCDPPSEGRLCCMAPVIIVSLMAFAAVYILLTFYVVIALGPVTFGVVLAIILKISSSRASKWKIPIGIVAMISFSVVFLPSFVPHCLFIAHVDVPYIVFVHIVHGTNFQLVLDALLCFFILKLHMEEQQKRQRPNNDSAVPLSEVHSNPPEYDGGFASCGKIVENRGDSCGDIDGGDSS